jgi:hypothetical protein
MVSSPVRTAKRGKNKKPPAMAALVFYYGSIDSLLENADVVKNVK